MYKPELKGITGFADSVLVVTGDGVRVGHYKGNARPESESFQIHLIDPMTGDVDEVSYFHKEDLYENTAENWERLT